MAEVKRGEKDKARVTFLQLPGYHATAYFNPKLHQRLQASGTLGFHTGLQAAGTFLVADAAGLSCVSSLARPLCRWHPPPAVRAPGTPY